MTQAHDPNILPAGLAVPKDDGAARHLAGMRVPSVALAATDGSTIDLSVLVGRTVVYVYPRTGVPGEPPLDGWDAIPGARGCTPQSCSFRDHFAELKRLGVDHLYGLSTQDSAYPIRARPSDGCICPFQFSRIAIARLPARSSFRPSRLPA